MTRLFIVKCAYCNRMQKCEIKEKYPHGVRKECICCGCYFTIHNGIDDTRIIREIKQESKKYEKQLKLN